MYLCPWQGFFTFCSVIRSVGPSGRPAASQVTLSEWARSDSRSRVPQPGLSHRQRDISGHPVGGNMGAARLFLSIPDRRTGLP